MAQFKVSPDQKIDGKNLSLDTPIRLEEALQKLEEKFGLKLPIHSILILINGVESTIVGGPDAMIEESDEVAIIPMFHGG
jgi:molybdopterin converting factor small subunit